MPQKGRPSRNRYRNTSDLSNGVQRANVSGNVPQQNLKRREAAFLLGATAFRTREMQKNALSPFVEVRQIEFLSRETPNCTLPRTYTHIPSMDMRERERFASQGAKRRGRNTTHPLDPDKLTKMEPRVPSLHCNLKREQNPAFLVSGAARTILYARRRGAGAQRPDD